MTQHGSATGTSCSYAQVFLFSASEITRELETPWKRTCTVAVTVQGKKFAHILFIYLFILVFPTFYSECRK